MAQNRVHLGIALVLALLSAADAYRTYISGQLVNPLYVLLSLCAWGSFLVAIVCIAYNGAILARREAVAVREAVGSILFRWRFLLAVAIGLIPVLVFQTIYINASEEAEVWTFSCSQVNTCEPPVPTQADWVAGSLSLLATAIGLSGTVLFSAALGYTIGKRFQHELSWIAAIGLSVVMMVVVILLAGNPDPLASFDVPIARTVIFMLLPYVLAAVLLSR